MKNLKILVLTALIGFGVYLLLISIKVSPDSNYSPKTANLNIDTLNKSNLKRKIYNLGIKYPEIVIKQVYHETGHLTSNICKSYNNLFGFRLKSGYIRFNNWIESIVYYKKWQDRHYKSGDYYTFLEDIGYAEDSLYIQKLKKIKV